MFSSSADTFRSPFSVSSALLRCSAFMPAHQVRQLLVERGEPRPALPHPREPQHRHRLVGLDLAEPLHDPPDAPRARVGPDEDGKAHVPGRIDPEIARDDRGAVEDAAHGKAFGHEPLVELPADPVVARHLLHPDQRRGEPRPRRLRQPVLGKDAEGIRIERPVRHALPEDRVGHELGMALPLELVPPDLAEVVRGPRLRMLRPEPVEQRDQMRPVKRPVPLRRVLRLLDRKIGRPARRLERREGPGVQLVGKLVTQRVVVDHRHP